jgi:hypothetical protein
MPAAGSRRRLPASRAELDEALRLAAKLGVSVNIEIRPIAAARRDRKAVAAAPSF